MNPFLYDLEQHKLAFVSDTIPDYKTRSERVLRLISMLKENEENLCKAIMADFGYRQEVETKIADFVSVYQEAKYALRNLAKWMKPVKVKTPFHLMPSKGWMMPQPKGVVGIMSPWNYPLNLALIPVISAIAAGNRVWLKPSERAPRTSGYLATLVQQYFHPTEFTVINGGPQVSQHFSSLPFDHLLFTGSTETGRQVAKAAAENLTPVTLELGGKSPLVIDASARLNDCAKRILFGKLFNAGQTCIAPDYVLVPHALQNELIDSLQSAYTQMYPEHSGITHAIDERQSHRWQTMIDDAIQKGAKVVTLGSSTVAHGSTQATLILNANSQTQVMNEEIFGPILPIIGYKDLSEAIEFINQHPRPLTAYWFGSHQGRLHDFLNKTSSGGVMVNDTLIQFTNHYLPFGGIGLSGNGAYHGKFGFDTFTHFKPVFSMRRPLGISTLGGSALIQPPYNDKVQKIMKILEKL
jgi:coniferyl-aldehyde dehydrogenase